MPYGSAYDVQLCYTLRYYNQCIQVLVFYVIFVNDSFSVTGEAAFDLDCWFMLDTTAEYIPLISHSFATLRIVFVPFSCFVIYTHKRK